MENFIRFCIRSWFGPQKVQISLLKWIELTWRIGWRIQTEIFGLLMSSKTSPDFSPHCDLDPKIWISLLKLENVTFYLGRWIRKCHQFSCGSIRALESDFQPNLYLGPKIRILFLKSEKLTLLRLLLSKTSSDCLSYHDLGPEMQISLSTWAQLTWLVKSNEVSNRDIWVAVFENLIRFFTRLRLGTSHKWFQNVINISKRTILFWSSFMSTLQLQAIFDSAVYYMITR